MTDETEFLEQLAERPFDRALRLVFADWLQEQGNPRGEVIALSLKGSLSLTEKRRILKVTQAHGAEWLGPLAHHVNVAATRWLGGFPNEVSFTSRVTEQDLAAIASDPRWACVRSLTVPPLRRAREVRPLLLSERLRQVKRLVAEVGVWKQLAGEPTPYTLETLGLMSWEGVDDAELETFSTSLQRIPRVVSDATLELLPNEFVNGFNAARVHRALLARPFWERRFSTLQLNITHGVLEGAASWIDAGSAAGSWVTTTTAGTDAERWAAGRCWSVHHSEILFSLTREHTGTPFTHLVIDVSAPKKNQGLSQRLASIAAILVQLHARPLTDIEVITEAGATLRAAERDALRASIRRFGQIELRVSERAVPM